MHIQQSLHTLPQNALSSFSQYIIVLALLSPVAIHAFVDSKFNSRVMTTPDSAPIIRKQHRKNIQSDAQDQQKVPAQTLLPISAQPRAETQLESHAVNKDLKAKL